MGGGSRISLEIRFGMTYQIPIPTTIALRMYQAEIKNLDRMLEALARTGAIPTGVLMPSTVRRITLLLEWHWKLIRVHWCGE